jgi:hypothetical protein
MKKIIVALTLAGLFILMIAATALAGYVSWSG